MSFWGFLVSQSKTFRLDLVRLALDECGVNPEKQAENSYTTIDHSSEAGVVGAGGEFFVIVKFVSVYLVVLGPLHKSDHSLSSQATTRSKTHRVR